MHEWQQRNQASSLPLAPRQLEDAGNLDNVRLAVQTDRAASRALTDGANGSDPEGTSHAAPVDGYGAAGGRGGAAVAGLERQYAYIGKQ
jgi:hypothetical protein